MSNELQPNVCLLGGGYSLQQVASQSDAGSFIVTSRNSVTVDSFAKRGWVAEVIDTLNNDSIQSVFDRYPNITTIVDSVPPIRNTSDPLAGIRNLTNALKGRKIHLIYLSTTGVFGEEEGNWVDEATIASPKNVFATHRLLSENLYKGSGLQASVLRLPAIYGPDRGVHVAIKEGRYKLIGDGTRWTNRIHVVDLARVIRRIVELGPDAPELLCVGDDYPATQKEVAEYFSKILGLPMPGFISLEEAKRHGHHTMLSNQRIRNDLMKKVLGEPLKFSSFKGSED